MMNHLLHPHRRLPSSLSLFLTTQLTSSCHHPLLNLYSISIHRFFLSTAATEAPPPKPNFSAVDYLVQSCGLSSQEALRASKKIDHLKSPAKPDAVLRFLRETGISESDIRKAVLRKPCILRSGVETNWRPNIAKLQEAGLSNSDISSLISRCPYLFEYNIVSKVDFWLRTLGSLDHLYVVLKMGSRVLGASLEKVIVPNLSFLQKQLHLDLCQTNRLLKTAPYLITCVPQALMIKANEAEELGVPRSSPMFVYALIIVSNLNRRTIDARFNNLKRCGFSQEEVSALVSNQPFVLKIPEELMCRKLEFLMKEAGCDNSQVIRQPSLLTYSLDKRLIPRNLVRKLLESKGFPLEKTTFNSFAKHNDKQFVEKFILPYEHAIPGLHQAYIDACSGKASAKEWFGTALT